MKGLKYSLFYLTTFFSFFLCSQENKDTLGYERYAHKIVVYSDLGYSTSPFSMHYPFTKDISHIKYRNNFRNFMGFGLLYKWFSMRLSFAVPGTDKNIEKYGKTSSINVGFDFTWKKVFYDVDLRIYKGYAVKNSYLWDKDFTNSKKNFISPNLTTSSFSINTWYFHNKNFRMSAARGKSAHFIRKVQTWYAKTTFSIYGVGNDQTSIIPTQLIDSNNTKTAATTLSAVDFGFLPGYAYANRKNNWQITGMFGLGGVIQNKIYTVDGYSRGILGLAPRYDIKLIGGYSKPRYFVFLVTDFDNKSIKFQSFKYNQTYYAIKIVGGIRFDTLHEKREKRKSKK